MPYSLHFLKGIDSIFVYSFKWAEIRNEIQEMNRFFVVCYFQMENYEQFHKKKVEVTNNEHIIPSK